jgi:hypothetical protein
MHFGLCVTWRCWITDVASFWMEREDYYVLWNTYWLLLVTCLFGLLIHPEEGGSTFPWSIDKLPADHRALHPRRQYLHNHRRENLQSNSLFRNWSRTSKRVQCTEVRMYTYWIQVRVITLVLKCSALWKLSWSEIIFSVGGCIRVCNNVISFLHKTIKRTR